MNPALRQKQTGPVPAPAYFRSLWRKARRHPFLATAMLALLVLIAYALGVIAWHANAERYYRKALAELDRSVSAQTGEHLAQAHASLALCLQARPDSLDVNFLAARTARRLSAYAEAEERLRHYQELGGVPEATELERALAKLQQGDLSYASYFWSCVDKDHPDKVPILEALAQGYLQTYQQGSAKVALTRWLELQPNCLQALLWLGRVHGTLMDYPAAIVVYERALQLDPESDEARLKLAEILVHTQKAKEALPHFEILSERQPGNIAVMLGLGRCQEQLGDTDEARKTFDRILWAKPDDPAVLAACGKLLLNSGQLVEAESRLRAALRLDPYDREALYSMYKCLELRDKKNEAQKFLDEYNRVDKDLERCKELARQVLQGDNSADPRCELARTLMRNGRFNEAKRWLDDALRVDEKCREAYLLLAEYYDHARQAELAEKCRKLAAVLPARGK
jgi:tetratricopeptide (TPR) repeat protein